MERPQKITFGEMRESGCSACGKRGADIRPDFHWDKPGAKAAQLQS
jgi:hypothetical protein